MGTRIIESKEIVREILSGTTDLMLMQKYDLTCEDLENVFRKLLDARAINHIDVLAWSLFGNKIISTKHIRLFPRQSLDFVLPVFETDFPDREGTVRNVSQKGLGTLGIGASVGQVKSFSIALDLSRQVVSRPFEARCRWVRLHKLYETITCGFEVMASSKETWQKILNGIRMVRYLVDQRSVA